MDSDRIEPPRRLRDGAPGWLALLASMAALVCMACGLGQSSVDAQIEYADELLAEGRTREAVLAYHAAAQLAPDDVEVNRKVAEASLHAGFAGDAIDFYREVHYLAPDDHATTLVLAGLLVSTDAQQARELIDGVLAARPDDPDALLALAAVDTFEGKTASAESLVERARKMAPDDPEVYWALARINEAKIQNIRTGSGRRVQSSESYQTVIDSYQRYLDLGGRQKVAALLAQARLLVKWPGKRQEATEAYTKVMQVAMEEATRGEQIQALSATSHFARSARDSALQRSALEALTSIDPENIQAWDDLARLDPPGDPSWADRVYARMLESQPQNAAAHVVFAQHLARSKNPPSAIAHLDAQREAGLDEAALLSAIADLQMKYGFQREAVDTVSLLASKHPDFPGTALLVARQKLMSNDYAAAAATLRALSDELHNADTLRMLALVEHHLGNFDEALAAVDRALETAPPGATEGRALKAQILIDMTEYRRAVAVLKDLNRMRPLTPGEELMLISAYYDANMLPFGRKLLVEMLEEDRGGPAAALEFARREGTSPRQRETARNYLTRAFMKHPRNIELLEAIVDLDIADGQAVQALARLHRYIRRQPKDPDLLLLRAQTEFVVGLMAKARDTVREAVALGPADLNAPYELLAAIHAKANRPDLLLEELTTADAAGELDANDLALLGRLHLLLGDEPKATATYERALAAGSQLSLLKNDLAYLLAKNGGDLARAEALAQQAIEAPGDRLAATDTLGYVYYQAGNYEAARWQFRFVTERAKPPEAEYFYHYALALIKLDRPHDAKRALDAAIAVRPDYPEARAARDTITSATTSPDSAVQS